MSASQSKTKKYSALLFSLQIFVPVAVETLGPWNDEGLALIAEIGRRTSMITADPREDLFLFQRISVAVQRRNAASFTGHSRMTLRCSWTTRLFNISTLNHLNIS